MRGAAPGQGDDQRRVERDRSREDLVPERPHEAHLALVLNSAESVRPTADNSAARPLE